MRREEFRDLKVFTTLGDIKTIKLYKHWFHPQQASGAALKKHSQQQLVSAAQTREKHLFLLQVLDF